MIKKLNNSLLLLIIIFLAQPLYGRVCCQKNILGSEIIHLNRGLESFALGGVTGGLEEKAGNFLLNPALSATLLQKAIVLNPSYSTERINALSSSYFHPTDYGVFGGHYNHFFDFETEDYFFSVGPNFSKEISTLILFGFALNFDYYSILDPTVARVDSMPFGVNLNLSIALSPSWSMSKSIFAFKDFIGSIQVDQVGLLPWKKDKEGNKYYLKSSDLIKLGIGFTFLEAPLPNNFGRWRARILSDIALNFPIESSYNFGLKYDFLFNHKFKELFLMIGFLGDVATKEVFPITSGIGMGFQVDKEVTVEINYALGIKNKTEIETFHSLGFTIYFGELDTEKPVIKSSLGNEGAIDGGVIE